MSKAGSPALVVAEWLGYAASPTFALMALMSGFAGSSSVDTLCVARHGSALGGMVPMYLLMAAFHLAPWLSLAAGRRSGKETDAVATQT